jgi:glutamyl-tRNA reductase
MEPVVKRRKQRPLFLIDIAVPRDVEPHVAKLANVFLYDVDDLERVLAENLKLRLKEAEAAERIVEHEVRSFGEWLRSQASVPTIKELRARAMAIVKAELERTLPALDEGAHAKVTAMANAIANKLLHAPLAAMREDEELAQAARKLFDLETEQPAANPQISEPAVGKGRS